MIKEIWIFLSTGYLVILKTNKHIYWYSLTIINEIIIRESHIKNIKIITTFVKQWQEMHLTFTGISTPLSLFKIGIKDTIQYGDFLIYPGIYFCYLFEGKQILTFYLLSCFLIIGSDKLLKFDVDWMKTTLDKGKLNQE